jgi:alpha-aminoadipate carrier protein LysW
MNAQEQPHGTSKGTSIGECPLCATKIGGEGRELSEVIICQGCDAELEVVAVSPLTIAEAPEVEEDWGE